jgi:hypothetical protein
MRLGTLGDDEGGGVANPAYWYEGYEPPQRQMVEYAGRVFYSPGRLLDINGVQYIEFDPGYWTAGSFYGRQDLLDPFLNAIEYSKIEQDGVTWIPSALYAQSQMQLTPFAHQSGRTIFGGPRIWQETLESVGLPGDPLGSMIEAGKGPILVAAVATAGIAAGAFAGSEIATEGGTLLATGEGLTAAEISATEYTAYASEFGALEGGSTAFDAALIEGPAASELSASEFSALADAADTFEMGASAPASQSLSLPPNTLPSPPPSGGGFPMPSMSTIAQRALPLALKALSKSGSGTVSPPRPVASPQPLYLTGAGDEYLTGFQDNRMLWIVGGVFAALGLLSVTRRKGKRS